MLLSHEERLFTIYRYFFGHIVQLDEHFSRPMKEFVSLCLKKVPAEVSTCTIIISH